MMLPEQIRHAKIDDPVKALPFFRTSAEHIFLKHIRMHVVVSVRDIQIATQHDFSPLVQQSIQVFDERVKEVGFLSIILLSQWDVCIDNG
jgi:hypothetical protein